jgi:predicted acetyltransferase
MSMDAYPRSVPTLSEPRVEVHRSFLAAMAEFRAEGRGGTDDHSTVGEDHRSWAAEWWVDGAEYLGRVGIRNRLTPALRERGGHIGYDIRPTARRLGHATAMLRAALPVARWLGLTEALLTTDPDNVASQKVILANGGELAEAGAATYYFRISLRG